MTWSPPAELEEYRIIRLLGAGAMGQVYLAHDTLLDRTVAIKFISAVEVGLGARERFFTEARAVARLTHPNVVGIHRVGEVRRRPYLVSEYVRGSSLDSVPKPLPWERTLKIGIGLARGLASAHRRGVLHRDIKPANVMLGEDDEAKLLDFGLAKLVGAVVTESRCEHPAARPLAVHVDRVTDATTSIAERPTRSDERPATNGERTEIVQPGLTVDGAIVGTPLYLAPELWRGEPASRRSDVYALGIVLYELAAGRAPHAGLAFAELSTRAGSDDITPVASLAAALPTRLAEVIDACVSRDPSRRPDSGDTLCELLEAVIPRVATSLVEGSPYRGLSTFEPEHRALFFGRADETRAIVERLRTETFVVVAGDSGAGKSSLCRAAVLPAIAEKSLAGRQWRIATLVPGPRPLAGLEAVLASRAPEEGLLLFVDQMEELLTVSDREEAGAVAERLAELVVATSHVRVLASARSDFLGRLAGLNGIGELIGRALFLLGPLGDRGLRDAIVGPARALGYEFESPETVDELVASGRRHLPLLQFTLAELWDARDDETRKVPVDALGRIGGVAGALARRADQVMAALGDADRAIAWRVLVRLMTAEGTRAVLTRGELGETAGDPVIVERVVERLVGARLLVVAPSGDDHVEIVHEALFTGWPRLVEWRRAHEEGARMRDQHAEAARRWHERGRPHGLLWRGDALAEYRVWRKRWAEPPTGLEAAFGEASEAEARRTRTIRAGLLALVLAALSIGIVVLYRSDLRAERERDEAVTQRAEADRQRRSLFVEQAVQELSNGRPARALPYLAQAMREGDDTPALRVLVAEAIRPIEREVATMREFVDGVTSLAWAPDGSRFAATGMEGTLRFYDPNGTVVRVVSLDRGPLRNVTPFGIRFSPDSTRVAIISGVHEHATKPAYLWIVGPGEPLVLPHGGHIVDVRFDRKGKRVVTTANDGLRIWDAHTGQLRLRLASGPRRAPQCATFSPEGDTVIAGMEDGSLDVIEVTSGRRIARFGTATTRLRCGVEFTTDGSRLVVLDRELQLLDRTYRLIATIPGEITRFDLSADSKRLVTGAQDGSVRIWDAQTGTSITSVAGHPAAIGSVAFSHDGTRIVTMGQDRTFRVWNAAGGHAEMIFDAPVTSPSAPHSSAYAVDARFSPDGTRLLTAAGNQLTLSRVGREPLLEELALDGSSFSARLSPDERYLATAGHTGRLDIWELARHVEIARVQLSPILWDVAWSPDGTQLLASGSGGQARIFTMRGEPVRDLEGHDPEHVINRAAWSPDGRRIVTTSDDHTARIWDPATGKNVVTLRHPHRVLGGSWSADGTRLATAGWDGILRVWDAATGRPLAELGGNFRFLDVAMSPDGTRLAASTHAGVVTVWDLASRKQLLSINGHTGPVTTVAWSPDGALLATSSSDLTARIWDAATGRPLATRAHRSEVMQVSWSRDGTRIVTGSGDNSARIWDVQRDRRSLPELVDFVERRVPWKLVDGRLEVVTPESTR